MRNFIQWLENKLESFSSADPDYDAAFKHSLMKKFGLTDADYDQVQHNVDIDNPDSPFDQEPWHPETDEHWSQVHKLLSIILGSKQDIHNLLNHLERDPVGTQLFQQLFHPHLKPSEVEDFLKTIKELGNYKSSKTPEPTKHGMGKMHSIIFNRRVIPPATVG